MTLEKYISEFEFKPLKTHIVVPSETTRFLHDFPTLRLQIEKWNSVFPEDTRHVQSQLETIALIPRLSTLGIGLLINEIVSQMPSDEAYVNIGTWHGFSLCAAFPGNEEKICIGVDNFSEFGSPREACTQNIETHKTGVGHHFFDMDYRQYFLQHSLPIGFYFYDGEHSYEHQLKGLEIAEPFLAKNGIIMVDDTNWEDPRKATLEFMKRHPVHYEIIADLTTACDRHPTWWNGLMLLRKVI